MTHQYITKDIELSLIENIRKHDTKKNEYNIIIPYQPINNILEQSCILLPVLNDIIKEYINDEIKFTCVVRRNKNNTYDLNFVLHGTINFKIYRIQYSIDILINYSKHLYRLETYMAKRSSFMVDSNNSYAYCDHLIFIDNYFKQKYNIENYVNSKKNYMQYIYKLSDNENENNIYLCCKLASTRKWIRQINIEHLEISAHIIHQLNNIIKQECNIICSD